MIGYGWPLDGEAKKVHDIERSRASIVCSFVNINSDNSTRMASNPKSQGSGYFSTMHSTVAAAQAFIAHFIIYK